MKKQGNPNIGTGRRVPAADIVRMRVHYMPWSDRFAGFVGNIPCGKRFSASLTGGPGSGKSTYSIMISEEFARFKPVLYIAAEESLDAGGIRKRLIETNISTRNFDFVETVQWDVLIEELDSGDFGYCIVDSVSSIFNGEDRMDEVDVVRNLLQRYPLITFIFILHTDKSRLTYKGPAELTHLVDIEWFAKGKDAEPRYVRNRKNRFYATQTEFHVFTPPPLSSKQNKEAKQFTWPQMLAALRNKQQTDKLERNARRMA